MSDGCSEARRGLTIREYKMKKDIKIYICSPYTHGWQSDNVRRQLEVANILMDNKIYPYTPLLNHFQELAFPRTEHDWLDLDIVYLKVCDGLIRFHPKYTSGDHIGEDIPSTGCDLEEKVAKENNIPVWHFDSIEDFKNRITYIKQYYAT